MTRAIYTSARGISQEVHDKNKLEESPTQITIPVFNRDGDFLFNKYRMLEGNIKYRYDKGGKATLYNAQNVEVFRTNKLFITEGEFDAMVLQSQGYNAVSSTGGAGTFKTEWLDEFKHMIITITFDHDEAGIRAAVRLYKALKREGVVCNILEMLPIKSLSDATDYYKKDMLDAFLDLPRIAPEIDMPPVYYSAEYKKLELSRNMSYLIEFERLANIELQQAQAKARRAEKKDLGDDIHKIKTEVEIAHYMHEVTKNGGWVKCLWHNDSNPSAKYNTPENNIHPNTIHCYSCGAHKTVIDVVMHQYDLSFIQALQKIKEDFKR